ncbi:MAG: 4Fe-4S binding protein [Azoarcus sp. PHD]|nr:MAG: 4Fe-4S binding protein [Azoarcus sp. PHD]
MPEALKSVFPSLSRVRLWVQIVMLFVTVWGASVVGHYSAEKISDALPALSCAYDMQNGSYCVLIPLQHQMHHRVGEALVKAQDVTLKILLPLAMTVLTFLAFFFVLGKAFCGWVCPLGTLQEIIQRIGRRFALPLHRLSGDRLGRVRPVKWLVVLALVLVFPLLTGLGVTPHEFGNPYCDVCPSRIATTLLSGNTNEFALNMESAWGFAIGALGNTLFGFVAVGALAIRQPFCRICPMLALNAAFRHLSLARLVKKPHDKCEKCGICAKACPMDITEIHTEHGRKAYHDDCTLCGRCAEFCPDDDVIQVKLGPFALFRSSRDYYKKRMAAEMPDGTVKPIRIVRKPATGDQP